MKILRAGLVLATSVAIKALCGMVLIKVFAILLDVPGFGRVGQFMGLIGVLTVLGGGAQMHGLIRSLSALGNNCELRSKYQRVSSMIAISFGAIGAILLVFFRSQIAFLLVGDAVYGTLLVPIAAGFIFSGVNNLQIAALSAAGKLNELSISQSLGSVFGTAVCVLAALAYGEAGAVAGFAALSLCNSIASGWYVRRAGLWKLSDAKPLFDWPVAKELLQYSLALTLAAAFFPLSLIYVRSAVGEAFGWAAVGFWQAVLKLSDLISQLFGTLYNNYILAHLSRLPDGKPTRSFMRQAIVFVFCSAVVIYALAYLFRFIYIWIALTPEYSVIEDLMPAQFVGDVLRMVVSLAGYYYLARRRLVGYVALALYPAVAYALFSTLLIHWDDGLAPVRAHFLAYATLIVILLGVVGLRRYRAISDPSS